MKLDIVKEDIINCDIYKIPEPVYIDHKNKIYIKPWGYEKLIYENNHLAIWCLNMKKNESTSFHCHYHKESKMILLSGSAKIKTFDKIIEQSKLSIYTIPACKFHSLLSLSDDTVILEIEVFDSTITFSDKCDIYRYNDKYNRKTETITSTTIDTQNYDIFYLENTIQKYGINISILENANKGGIILETSNEYMKPGEYVKGNYFNCKVLNLSNIL